MITPQNPKITKKMLLQSSVGALNISEPVRLTHVVDTEKTETTLNAANGPIGASKPPVLDSPHSLENSSILAESGSPCDSVTPGQSHMVILSHAKSEENRVIPRQCHPVTESCGNPVPIKNQVPTGSRDNTVKPRQSQMMTESSLDAVPDRAPEKTDDSSNIKKFPTVLSTGKLRPKDHFCAIPTILISEGGLFVNSYDFMIYLHLFVKSYGFGRNTCDMGLNELVGFTGMARNSVKKSLDHLSDQKWIRMVSNFEYGRVTRKWRVYSPYEKGVSPHPTFQMTNAEATEQVSTIPESHLAEPTGSSGDPYINKRINNYKNNSLSPLPDPLQKYFSELKPQRKKESELQAFDEIRKDFPADKIADCVEYLSQKGLPGGGQCHSPMAYLAYSMKDILAIVQGRQETERIRAEIASRKEREDSEQKAAELLEQAESGKRELAFNRAFGSTERQQEVIAEFCRNHKFIINRGPAARAFAVNYWWHSLSKCEQLEATA